MRRFTVEVPRQQFAAEGLSAPEQAFVAAVLGVVEVHGQFGTDSGMYVEYHPPAENENREIGVRCGNCAFNAGDGACRIQPEPIEPDGACRLAVIPPGVVS